MAHPLKFTQLPTDIPLNALSMCECGAVVLNQAMHDAYHSWNDREMY